MSTPDATPAMRRTFRTHRVHLTAVAITAHRPEQLRSERGGV